MAELPDDFNFGDDDIDSPEGLRQLVARLYTDLARAINQKPDLVFRTAADIPTDGSPTDFFLANGTININTATNKVEMLTNHLTSETVTWTTLS